MCELIFLEPDPLFLTSTSAVGLTAGPIDVSLRYVFKKEVVINLMNLTKRDSKA